MAEPVTGPPRATYRLQLRGGMGFARAAAIVPYLAGLGISHLYLSPPFAAGPGSTHGYDVVDPNRLDPELGGEEGFMVLRRALDAHGLGLILDIVPNHMGVGAANPWWRDVLRHGRESRFAGHFDIDFSADPDGRLVLPVLGAPLDEVLAEGGLRLTREGGEPELALGDQRFPLAPGSDPEAPLAELVDAQHYRLVRWREGGGRRNYRRFFNIDQLAGLRVERPEVFEDSHRLILDLARRGLIQGLRIDHI
ncbi:MAG: alpha-amylase family glycosyl hydrolase, partial [Geminicoccaceae bacterium]